MKSQNKPQRMLRFGLPHVWILFAIFLLGAYLLVDDAPVWAENAQQTIPTPTPRSNDNSAPTNPSSNDSDTDERDDSLAQDEDDEQNEERDESLTGRTATVSSLRLNIHSGPSAEYAIIDTLFRTDVVEALGISESGEWLFVCCGRRTGREGWVELRSVELAPIQVGAVDELPVLSTEPDAASPAVQSAVPPDASAAVTSSVPLTMSIGLQKPYLWPGQQVQISIVVGNPPGAEAAQSLTLRSELPAGLNYISAATGANGLLQSASAGGGNDLLVEWPALTAGEQVTATLTVGLSENVNDSVLQGDIFVRTAGRPDTVQTILLALPPAVLPDF